MPLDPMVLLSDNKDELKKLNRCDQDNLKYEN